MKKALLVFLALALIASVAFAEVSVSAYGRGLWNVAANGEDDNIESSLVSSWTPTSAPYVRTFFRGASDYVRYGMSLNVWGNSLSLGSYSYIEMRPGDWAAFTIGKFAPTETQVGATFGIRNWYRLGSVRSAELGDFIFASLLDAGSTYLNDGGSNRGGMNARFYPIEGLTVGFQAPLNYIETGNLTEDSNPTNDIAAVWGNANAYVRYDISDIGTVRLGWDGRTKSGQGSAEDYYGVNLSKFNDVNNGWWGIIAAAFELKLAALPELYVGVGTRIPTKPVSENFTAAAGGRPFEVNAYATYNLDIATPLIFRALFGSKIMEENQTTSNATYNGFGCYVGVGVDWEVLEDVPVFVDVRYANGMYMNRSNAPGEDNITFGVGISRRWSNGELGIAFEGSTNGYGRGYGAHRTYTSYREGWTSGDDCFVWAIPVKFQMMF